MGQGPRGHRPEAHRHRGQLLRLRQAAARELAIVRQRWGNDCGPAALATMAAHHERPVAWDDLLTSLVIDGHGTNLLALARAAQGLGFRATGVTASYDAIGECPLPAIAHVRRRIRGGHFVVVHRWTPAHVVVADPAAGLRKITRHSFCRRWTGYFLLVEPTKVEVVDGWAQ